MTEDGPDALPADGRRPFTRRAALASAAAWSAASVVPRQAAGQEPLVLGVVPQFESRRLAAIWDPLLAALQVGGAPPMVMHGAPDIPAFESAFSAGVYDVAYLNPYHVLMAHDAQGYEPVLCDSAQRLSGILVVARDSPAQSPADLAGAHITFPAPNSLGAKLLIRAELEREFGLTDYVATFAGSHESAYLNVALGIADAAGGIDATFGLLDPELQARLRVLHRTASVPPHAIAVHPRVAPHSREQLVTAVLALAATADGAALLAAVPMSKPAPATIADYEPLRAMGLERFVVPSVPGAAP